ncbi:hypothetical protein BDR26DRAFT_868376 [Obelidium mucronatum]|nr:hypothetical protein BDR26DRAFT_868376 [Obelidium mucronatum]
MHSCVLTELPVELIEEILSWINPSNSIRLARLCSKFAAIVSSSHFANLNLARLGLLKPTATTVTTTKTTTPWISNLNSAWFHWPQNYQEVYCQHILVAPINLHNSTNTNSSIDGIKWTSKSQRGRIPSCLNIITYLKRLDLCFNELAGPIPDTLTELVHLEILYLDHNKLTGTIPANLFSRCPRLRCVRLCDNELEGEIPSNLGDAMCLEYFNVSRNRLTGRIPESVGQLVYLEEFGASSNGLVGEVPLQLLGLEDLKCLYLKNNEGLDYDRIQYVIDKEVHLISLHQTDVKAIADCLPGRVDLHVSR